MKSIDEINKIADLAKLSLDGEDMAALLSDMANFIAVADTVRAADLTGLDCGCGRENAPMRGDVLKPSYPVDELLRSSGDSRDGHYVAEIGGRVAR